MPGVGGVLAAIARERPVPVYFIGVGESVEATPPHLRHVNTVFQDYALFPHLTVAQNVEYFGALYPGRRSTAKADAAEAIDAARWMHTGDLAVMADDGYVAVTGRMKDMVIRGGENIYPREIEEFLYGHPSVQDVQVIGVPDEKYGEELMAWVVLREGADSVDADGVREFCSGQLAHYKIPRYVHVVESFPMTVTGKVRKVEMREKALAILGLQQR